MSDIVGKSFGRYQILEQLGEGGMATVYKAYDTRLERDVAVKVIRTDQFAPAVLERMLKRFDREAKALARLTHPNIVSVIDYGDYEGAPYLVMPYLPGGTLKQQLGKAIPWQEAVHLVLPIAQALEFAHAHNIIHRDIKPANILLTESGQPLLTDFGIAKILENDDTMALTGTGVGLGTPEYMAPEQWTGEAGPQADIYSLGVVLYELIVGRKPYLADTPAAVLLKQMNEPLPRPGQFIHDLPDAVEKLLLKALARKTEDRYATMQQFVAALEKVLSDHLTTGEKFTSAFFQKPGSATTVIEKNVPAVQPVPAQSVVTPSYTPSAWTPPPAKKNRKWIIWVGVVAGLLALVICLVLGGGALLSYYKTIGGFNPPITDVSTITPAPSPTSVPSNILYQDDFSNSGSGWPDRTSGNDKMGYINGSYHIFVSGTYADMVSSAGASLPADVAIDVDITKASGSDNNDFGVLCRWQDVDNFYFFEISSDGYAVIGMFLKNEMKYLSADAMQKVDGITAGSTTNHVRATCIGNTLSLYANGNLVATAVDSTFTTGGDAGLIAGSFDVGGIDILFDNFVVTRP